MTRETVMANSQERLALLDSTPTEMEAGVIVAALEQGGIQATMTGTHTAGFRAEAPGWVKIFVAENDLPRAQAVLSQVVLDNMDVDWSQVDVGEPTDEQGNESKNWLTSLSFWRRVAFVLIVICLAWLAAGIISDVVGFLLRTVAGTSAQD